MYTYAGKGYRWSAMYYILKPEVQLATEVLPTEVPRACRLPGFKYPIDQLKQ